MVDSRQTEACNTKPCPGDNQETCLDNIMNGEETGIDCGGNCPNECQGALTMDFKI